MRIQPTSYRASSSLPDNLLEGASRYHATGPGFWLHLFQNVSLPKVSCAQVGPTQGYSRIHISNDTYCERRCFQGSEKDNKN
jgi:hypothetical protein